MALEDRQRGADLRRPAESRLHPRGLATGGERLLRSQEQRTDLRQADLAGAPLVGQAAGHGQLPDQRLRHRLQNQRRVAARGVKAGHLFLVKDQDRAAAGAAQMVGGGGTGEAAADDDGVEVLHVRLVRRLLCRRPSVGPAGESNGPRPVLSIDCLPPAIVPGGDDPESPRRPGGVGARRSTSRRDYRPVGIPGGGLHRASKSALGRDGARAG